EARLAVDPVLYRYQWEIRAPGLAGFRVDRRRAGGAMAAAKIVQRYNEETVGINRLARADGGIPPAWTLVVHAVVASGVVMAGQGMADQYAIGLVDVQGTVGFIDDIVARERTPAFQRKRLIKMQGGRGDDADRISGNLFRHLGIERES